VGAYRAGEGAYVYTRPVPAVCILYAAVCLYGVYTAIRDYTRIRLHAYTHGLGCVYTGA
jgi:hypothetical protein